jgi:hypothetical protein
MHVNTAVILFLVYIILFGAAIWQYKHIWLSIGVILSLISLGGVYYILKCEERNLEQQYATVLHV